MVGNAVGGGFKQRQDQGHEEAPNGEVAMDKLSLGI
jgi:hypothetical protein